MTEEQIEYMAGRFCGWKRPENVNPDGGISFEPIGNKDHASPNVRFKREPSGTNLLDLQQAKDMVRYMIEGMP